jgi:lysophospholipase L1-like esterase
MRRLFPRAKLSSTDFKIVTAGNSLGAGVGASGTSTRWQGVMQTKQPLNGKGITLVNRAVAGMSIATNAGAGTMLAQAATIDADVDATKHNILIVHEFINDLKANNFNATASHTAWANYCLARKAAAKTKGAKLTIITMTTTPAGAVPAGEGQAWADSRNAAIIQANNLMRTHWAEYADILCDVAAYPVFANMFAANVWTPEAFIATGLWARSDGTADDYTHPGNAGYAVIGGMAAEAVKRVRPIPVAPVAEPPATAPTAPSIVGTPQVNYVNGVGTPATVTLADVQVGDLIVAGFSTYAAGNMPTTAITAPGITFNKAIATDVGIDADLAFNCFTGVATQAGSITITGSSGDYKGLVAMRVQNYDAAIFDGTPGFVDTYYNGDSLPVSVALEPTTYSHDLILYFGSWYESADMMVYDAAWPLIEGTGAPNSNNGSNMQNQIIVVGKQVTSTGTYTPAFTGQSNNGTPVGGIAFAIKGKNV